MLSNNYGIIGLICDVVMYVCVCPEAINDIHVTFNLYNQLNKFVVFRNVMKLSIHGCGLSNDVCCNRNQSNKDI